MVDSDSAASINLNMEQNNVNFHIKKQSKYPHVPPASEQKCNDLTELAASFCTFDHYVCFCSLCITGNSTFQNKLVDVWLETTESMIKSQRGEAALAPCLMLPCSLSLSS